MSCLRELSYALLQLETRANGCVAAEVVVPLLCGALGSLHGGLRKLRKMESAWNWAKDEGSLSFLEQIPVVFQPQLAFVVVVVIFVGALFLFPRLALSRAFLAILRRSHSLQRGPNSHTLLTCSQPGS